MNFTEYIRHIVQLRGYSFAYGDAREINRVLTTIDFSQSKNGIVAFAHLITEDENDDHARATLAVYFCHLCPFDFDANDTGEWQGYLRNAANTMFSDISAGNIARTSNMRYSYGYDDYAENVLWVCARFTIEALQCGCNEFVFRDEIVKNIEYVRTLENGDYEYKITFTDGSTQMFASPRGPKGGDGEPGPPGPPGTTDFNELQNKPTKLSDFENDEGFITSAYHDATKQDVVNDLDTIRSNAASGVTASAEAKGIAERAEVIARGRATGYVFDTIAEMNAWLAVPENVAKLNRGDNLYIIDTNVPDYWWDGTSVQTLETEHPDLSGYVKKTDKASYGSLGLVTTQPLFGLGVMYDGTLYCLMPTNAEIVAKSSMYKPITPYNLDYAVKVGLTSNTIELTPEEKAAAQQWFGITPITASEYEALEDKSGIHYVIPD